MSGEPGTHRTLPRLRRGPPEPVRGALSLGAALLVAASAPGGLVSQEPSSAPPELGGVGTLTLEEALELAVGHNPAYRRSVNEVELNPTASRSAWGSLLPELSVSQGTGTSFSQTVRELDFFGDPVDNPDPRRIYTSSANQSLSLSWSFQGLAPRHELAETRAANRGREVRRDRAAHRLRVEVSRAFHDAREEEELLALEEEMLEGRERDLEAAERLYALARRDRTDVLGAELELARQEGNIEEARGEVRKALLALGSAVGAPDLDEVRVEAEPVRVFDPGDLDVEALVGAALGRSPRVREAEAVLDQERAVRDAARWSRLPSLELSASLSRSAVGPDQETFLNLTPGDSRRGSLSFSLSLPVGELLLSGAHEEQQAEVELRNQSEEVREIRSEVEEEVRARHIDLATAYRRVELSERERELAEERLRLTQEGYRMARQPFDELQTAVRDAAEARREAVTARYDFVRARLDLEEALGLPLEAAVEGLPEGRGGP